jgi:hypothetical protein
MRGLRSLVLWLLLLSLWVPGASARTQTKVVTPGQAHKVASLLRQTLAESQQTDWAEARLGQPVLYVTPTGTADAYVLDIVAAASGSPLGYIVISATRDQTPVLEYGVGPAVNLSLPSAKKLAMQQGYDPSRYRLVHGGPTVFVAEFKDERHSTPLYVNLTQNNLIDDTYVVEPGPMDQPSVESANKKWSDLDAKVSSGIGIQALVEKEIANFPTTMDQSLTSHPNNGCGPTAGAAIVFWYAEYRGYPNLHRYGYDWVTKADHLYEDMETSIFGTSPTKWASGMTLHANTHGGYNFSTQVVEASSTDRWTAVKTEIDLDRPAGVYIGLSSTNSDQFEYHIMPVYGYSEEVQFGMRHLKVATNWGYAGTFDYPYYKSRYPVSFMWVRPG